METKLYINADHSQLFIYSFLLLYMWECNAHSKWPLNWGDVKYSYFYCSGLLASWSPVPVRPSRSCIINARVEVIDNESQYGLPVGTLRVCFNDNAVIVGGHKAKSSPVSERQRVVQSGAAISGWKNVKLFQTKSCWLIGVIFRITLIFIVYVLWSCFELW